MSFSGVDTYVPLGHDDDMPPLCLNLVLGYLPRHFTRLVLFRGLFQECGDDRF